MKELKHQKKEVTNKQYEEAYKDLDNTKVINKVLSLYQDLSSETRRDCGLKGLWRCLQFHEPDKGNKLTTSLWRFVKWECENEKKKLRSQKNQKRSKSIELFDVEDEAVEVMDVFHDIDNILDRESSSIIRLRFVEKMTLKEIGATFGYTKEAARQKLNHALEEVKRLVYNSE